MMMMMRKKEEEEGEKNDGDDYDDDGGGAGGGGGGGGGGARMIVSGLQSRITDPHPLDFPRKGRQKCCHGLLVKKIGPGCPLTCRVMRGPVQSRRKHCGTRCRTRSWARGGQGGEKEWKETKASRWKMVMRKTIITDNDNNGMNKKGGE